MLVDSNENRMQLSVVLLKYGDLVSKGYRVYNDNIGYNAIYSPWGTFIEDTSGFKVYEVFDSGAKESTKLVHLMSLSDKLMVEQGDFSYGNSKEI